VNTLCRFANIPSQFSSPSPALAVKSDARHRAILSPARFPFSRSYAAPLT
jgi:hypothetical protein